MRCGPKDQGRRTAQENRYAYSQHDENQSPLIPCRPYDYFLYEKADQADGGHGSSPGNQIGELELLEKKNREQSPEHNEFPLCEIQDVRGPVNGRET